mmetsp:Transcript_2548/g.7071  ORF Transcript_2548/g.7071 Transcript_2548/m.7071 type:complete len:157 (+) Transcript_2548:166-636(+)
MGNWKAGRIPNEMQWKVKQSTPSSREMALEHLHATFELGGRRETKSARMSMMTEEQTEAEDREDIKQDHKVLGKVSDKAQYNREKIASAHTRYSEDPENTEEPMEGTEEDTKGDTEEDGQVQHKEATEDSTQHGAPTGWVIHHEVGIPSPSQPHQR